MRSLGDLLKNNGISSAILKGVRAAKVMEETEKLLIKEFGPEIKNYVSPAYFKNRTLTIACLSSSAAQEIKLRESGLLAELNKIK